MRFFYDFPVYCIGRDVFEIVYVNYYVQNSLNVKFF